MGLICLLNKSGFSLFVKVYPKSLSREVHFHGWGIANKLLQKKKSRVKYPGSVSHDLLHIRWAFKRKNEGVWADVLNRKWFWRHTLPKVECKTSLFMVQFKCSLPMMLFLSFLISFMTIPSSITISTSSSMERFNYFHLLFKLSISLTSFKIGN